MKGSHSLLGAHSWSLLVLIIGLGLGGGVSQASGAEAAGLKREVALLDLAPFNNDTDSSTFSLKHALDVAGVPYVITTDLDEATGYSMVVTSSYLGSSTLDGDGDGTSNRTKLYDYVSGGGILVSAEVTDSALLPLFGVSAPITSKARHRMIWQTDGLDPTLSYFDDPNESTISLGSLSRASVITTRGYGLSGAISLAEFSDGTNAISKHPYGEGEAYALGFSFTDLILRNQLNRDLSAQRTRYNGFEPTSDTIMLFLRRVYEVNVPHAVWKYTSVQQSKGVLMLTHDVHPRSRIAAMNELADFEAGRGIVATYNIQTDYLPKNSKGDAYTPNIARFQTVAAQGHEIANHTVGHFKDWANESRFPLGSPGNTKETYTPSYDGTATTGGSVYGEIEVPTLLLKSDVGSDVRTFRSGSLYWNDQQVNVLDMLGYDYDSSNSANDVLTNFPYLLRYDRSFAGTISSVYEIPMTLWDLNMSQSNFESFVDAWLSVIERNAANFAPTVLLVHPHVDGALAAVTSLLDQLPQEIRILDMSTFGDFWRYRDEFTFETRLDEDALVIILPHSLELPGNAALSLFVRGGAELSELRVEREDGTPIEFESVVVDGTSLLVHGFKEADASTPLPATVVAAGANPGRTSRIVDMVEDQQDLTTAWSNDGQLATAWFSLDLGTGRTVDRLRVAPRGDRSFSLSVTIGDSLVDGRVSGSPTGTCDTLGDGPEVPDELLDCAVSGAGRYVTIAADRPWFRFYGIEVLGR